jgi:putative FmdB family regulatory protein
MKKACMANLKSASFEFCTESLMPTYEYECDACGHAFERFQSITAAPIKKCPICAKRSVRRLIGRGAGIIFKGSGFYQTDYRSDGYQKSAAAEKPSGGDKPAETSSSGAAAAKSETKKDKSVSKPAGKAAG